MLYKGFSEVLEVHEFKVRK